MSVNTIQLVKISELTPRPNNRNAHPDAQIERLIQIIKYQGFRRPITVSNLSGFVVCGHGRLEAAKRMNLGSVPVIYQDYEDEAQEYADHIADNSLQEWAELDLSGINLDLENLGPDFDIDLLGIKDFTLEPAEKFEAQSDEDSVPEHVEPKTKLGDIYQLGRHRLMCGDSTSIDAVETLMDGEKADMVFTDPPYGMDLNTDYRYGPDILHDGKPREKKVYEKVIGDQEEINFLNFYSTVESIKEQFWWGADYYCQQLPKNGSFIVWDKTGGNESLDNAGFGNNFEICWSKSHHKRDIFRYTYKGVAGMKKDDGKRVHPTQKPVDLCAQIINRWGKEAKTLIDLFGGSGSTLIACEKTNRKCFMMELDPHYCDVIVARWEKYTGKTAELIQKSEAS